MTIERYIPSEIEQRWYKHWMEQKLFAPSMDTSADPFCIVIPPPNVTGSLHMGHAWDSAIQDILIRWERMRGKNTLWIPGMDHSGIALQWMVERNLRERGQTKEELGREKFLAEAWAFKEASHDTIFEQLSRMGVSCDWSRERFTLDEGLSRAVRRVFVYLYREGLIYRGDRMVNWCPRCMTALSDLEVNYKEHDSFMYHFRYPMHEEEGYVAIATTRPETMLGDGAVAVHPDDQRYTDKVGKIVMLPLVDRLIPIIADQHPDPEVGSGAVKITAAHDPDDFEVAKRHDVPLIFIMEEDGRMSDHLPERYRNQDRFVARERVIEDLDRLGLVDRVERHVHQVGHCSRCDTVLEPRVSLQWFADMKAMAQASVEAVREKRIEILPEFQEKIFYEWMNNIRDWCVSRQLWWGHRIPAWYCRACGEIVVSEEDVTACTACGSSDLDMETDVLDTWFSSGLWPFSTMGWPDATEDLKIFYPTSVLVTGYDILFFWVARMAMLGIKFLEEIPFHQVLLHGLLRDQNGEKMSKTKGNGIDPLEMIEIYGADALRFTLASGTVLGRDMVLQEATIEGHRNFINKIWNATRFTLGYRDKLGDPKSLDDVTPGLFDGWVLGRLERVAGEANAFLEQRRFNEAAYALYHFVWHELCDWYVEIVKPLLNGERGEDPQAAAYATLHAVLDASLKLLHPIMPFVTEELWQRLPGASGSIMVQPYPAGGNGARHADQMAQAGRIIEVVQTVRTVRGESGVRPRQPVDVVLAAPRAALRELVERERLIVCTLADIGELTLAESFAKQEGYGHGVGDGFEVFLSLAGAIDVQQERTRIGRELARTEQKIEMLAAKLENKNFIAKAPGEVVEKNRRELSALRTQLEKLNEGLSQLPAG
ncbi:MAG: valine--tRNA ligase [SAR324 cluster bacterium]|nr:valine--tRNA ligase [SAR324 cluster bacterium]MCZ6629296.1 valine--tRNA ligase [SAR324 cluster bacterium]